MCAKDYIMSAMCAKDHIIMTSWTAHSAQHRSYTPWEGGKGGWGWGGGGSGQVSFKLSSC